jgi:hypothetical protein
MSDHGILKAWEATDLVNGERYKLNDPRSNKQKIFIDNIQMANGKLYWTEMN